MAQVIWFDVSAQCAVSVDAVCSSWRHGWICLGPSQSRESVEIYPGSLNLYVWTSLLGAKHGHYTCQWFL